MELATLRQQLWTHFQGLALDDYNKTKVKLILGSSMYSKLEQENATPE